MHCFLAGGGDVGEGAGDAGEEVGAAGQGICVGKTLGIILVHLEPAWCRRKELDFVC